MRIRQLVAEVRSALHVANVTCEFSDADLEAIVREAIKDVNCPSREHSIVDCALHKAEEACREIAHERTRGSRSRRK